MKKLVYSFMRSLKIYGIQYCLLLAGVLILLSGCSNYQYLAIASDAHQNKSQNFVVENDTAKIVYSFQGADFPVTVKVYNKLNKPLYVDWTKCALIIGGKSHSYWQNVAKFSGSSSGYSVKLWKGETQEWNDVTYNWSDISGSITKDEKVSFIPPGAFVSTTRFHLRSRFFSTQNSDSTEKIQFSSTNGHQNATVYKFSKNEVPLKFESYITMSTNKDFNTEFHFTNAFWVNNITQTSAPPNSLINNNIQKTYMYKGSSTGDVVGTIFILGIVAGIVALK